MVPFAHDHDELLLLPNVHNVYVNIKLTPGTILVLITLRLSQRTGRPDLDIVIMCLFLYHVILTPLRKSTT